MCAGTARRTGLALLTAVAALSLAGCAGTVTSPPPAGDDLGLPPDHGPATDVAASTELGQPPADLHSADRGAKDSAPSVDSAPPLPCDPGFAFKPSPPATGVINKVSYSTTKQGYAYVGLSVTGPGTAKVGGVTLTSSKTPWTWQFPVTMDQGGIWSVTFTADNGKPIASCQRAVSYTGAPPPLTVPPPPSCANKVCGDSDGAGGSCTRCPMVAAEGGACMQPPSPVTPGGQSSWSCLDSAGCSGSSCRIWCPGEPCDPVRHPDGCPQGVETCYVDPHITDYEEACRQCCKSRHHAPTGQYACWDDTYNICRYPGDCGKPFPLP